MRIFYYTWHENSEIDMTDSLRRMGHEVITCHIPFRNYEEDENFSSNLESIFLEYRCEIFLSFDFFPLIAKAANKLQKRYVAWVYDTPHRTLYSPSILSEYVDVFVFDKAQFLQVSTYKKSHIFHMPLAVNAVRLAKQLGELQEVDYKYDVSFVGSLYEGNLYKQINYLPDYLRGYVQGIIEVQKNIYGYNLIADALEEQEVTSFEEYVKLDINKTYFMDKKQIYVDMINAEITHQERVELLAEASRYFDVSLFTASSSELLPKDIFLGTLSYDKQMPEVFRESKINLNITLRSITSGIPLRALDIMGSGGFLLSNYQTELAECFIDGEEMVMFTSKEDMIDKIYYYLEHEEERKRIAYNGWKKVSDQYSYEVQLKKML